MPLSPRLHARSRTAPAPSSPLAIAPVVVPQPLESEWSDDSDSESSSSSSSTGAMCAGRKASARPATSTRRLVHSRRMHIRDPRSAGLYTLCEEEDSEETLHPTPEPAARRPHAFCAPRSAALPLSAQIPVVHTPGDEKEDPFALDVWSCDNPVEHAALARERDSVPRAPAPTPTSSPPSISAPTLGHTQPLGPLRKTKSKMTRSRPPPLELAAPDCPLSALRYPVSPLALDHVFNAPSGPTSPHSPLSPRSPCHLPIPPRSPIRPARVSAGSALPRTPTVTSSSTLIPGLPISVPEHHPHYRSWDGSQRDSLTSLSPEVQTPVTPTTPTLVDGDVNLVSVLRELLTSCGEYEGFADDDMFADLDTDADDELTPPGCAAEASERAPSPPAPSPPPRPPRRRQTSPAVPEFHALDEHTPFIAPPRSYSLPAPAPSRSERRGEYVHPRPRSSSVYPSASERSYPFFGHHAYLHSLAARAAATPEDPVCPLDVSRPASATASPVSTTPATFLATDKPLPVLEVCEPSDMDSDDERDDDECTGAFGSTVSLPGLTYSSSSASSIASPAECNTEWCPAPPSINIHTSDGDNADELIGIGIRIEFSERDLHSAHSRELERERERRLSPVPKDERIPPVPSIPPQYATAGKSSKKLGGSFRQRFLGGYSPVL